MDELALTVSNSLCSRNLCPGINSRLLSEEVGLNRKVDFTTTVPTEDLGDKKEAGRKAMLFLRQMIKNIKGEMWWWFLLPKAVRQMLAQQMLKEILNAIENIQKLHKEGAIELSEEDLKTLKEMAEKITAVLKKEEGPASKIIRTSRNNTHPEDNTSNEEVSGEEKVLLEICDAFC